MKVKKQRGNNHWTVPYCYAGRRADVHIWLMEDGSFKGQYHVYCGAMSTVKPTFEEAVEQARDFTNVGAL